MADQSGRKTPTESDVLAVFEKLGLLDPLERERFSAMAATCMFPTMPCPPPAEEPPPPLVLEGSTNS